MYQMSSQFCCCFKMTSNLFLIKEMRENTSWDLQDVKDACKDQMEVIEKEIFQNVDSLRCELTFIMDAIQQKIEARFKMDCNAFENLFLQTSAEICHS